MQGELNSLPGVEDIRGKATWAHKQEGSARERLSQASKAREFWDELAKHVAAGHPAHTLLLLRRAEGYLKGLQAASDPISPVLEELRLFAGNKAKEASTAFGRTFPEAVRLAGLEIDSTSRHPRYTFQRGFIRLEVDDRAFTARIEPRDGEVVEVGLDVNLLVETIKAEQTRIFDRPLRSEALLRSMYTAYLATLKSEGRQEGEDVPLRRLTNRMAKNLKQFSADEFNVDLARLINEGRMTFEGKRLYLNNTRMQRQGMLLHGQEEGGYVGFVSFRREES